MALTGAERQARYIRKLKDQAAYADVLAARLAEIEAQQANAYLARHEARQAVVRDDGKPLATRRVPARRVADRHHAR
jgi:hypothetical protein